MHAQREAGPREITGLHGFEIMPLAGAIAPRFGGTIHPTTGEHRLMLALLCDALHVFTDARPRVGTPRQRAELRAWFESPDRSYVFSFESICDALGLDPGYVRRRALARDPTARQVPRWHRVQSARIKPPRSSARFGPDATVGR